MAAKKSCIINDKIMPLKTKHRIIQSLKYVSKLYNILLE